MTLKKYMVYLDDGDNIFNLAIPAENEQSAREYASGNGEVVTISDVTSDYPISVERVTQALKQAGFGETETDLIMRTLLITDIATI